MTEPAAPTASRPAGLLAKSLLWARLLRPHQWLKNSFVFAGLLFGEPASEAQFASVLLAFASFCALASAVYVLNDWQDRVSDALHPTKRKRPLASGALSPGPALAVALALAATAFWLARDNRTLLALLALYALVNMAYTLRLKRLPVVDVFAIASGFMLRLLAGTLAVDIPPSGWLLLTGLFATLFLGFSKRRAETFQPAGGQREVLTSYTPALLDIFMGVTLTATLATYGLFATSDVALARHGQQLIYTVPVVVFAMLRYTWQVHRGYGEDVARDILRDPWVLAALVLWLGLFLGAEV